MNTGSRLPHAHTCAECGSPVDIYPLHTLDNIKENYSFVNWFMRFNDALDANQLNHALSRLFEIGDWKKLGGRLKRKPNGKLEIHVQKRSPKDKHNMYVYTTHNSYDMRLQDHPVACRLPKSTEGPSLHPISSEFRPLLARTNFPTFEEIIRQSLPPMSVHITSFRDATLIALIWPHVMMDALGGHALLAAWSSVLAGREHEVPKLVGARKDAHREVLETSGETIDGEFELEKKRLKGRELFKFQARFLWDMARNPNYERRVIYLPRETVLRLKKKVQAEIAHGAHGMAQKPFASEGDILTAWVARALAASQPKPRPMVIFSFLNTRFRFPSLLKWGGVFVQNMVLATYSFLTASQSQDSLASVAVSHRQQFTEQSTEEQTVHFMKSVFKDIDAGQSPRLIFGESDSVVLLTNNLFKANLIQSVDFSPAIVQQGEPAHERTNPPGTMVCYYNEAIGKADNLNIFMMLGKDYGENCWFLGTFLPQTWQKIEEAIQEL